MSDLGLAVLASAAAAESGPNLLVRVVGFLLLCLVVGTVAYAINWLVKRSRQDK